MPRPLGIILALMLAALPLAARELPFPRPNEKWISVRAGDGIEIFSNASPAMTATVARDLLRMREAVGKITSLQVRAPIPTKVFLFANERSFAPYRDTLFARRAENTTGMYLGGDTANYILLQGNSPSGVDRVVYHELTHSFVKNTVAHVPLWLSEGIAEYYSSFKTEGNEIHIGLPLSQHLSWLRSEQLIPLGQLFAVDTGSPDYNEGTRQGVFYAQSWALTHYLLVESEARRAQFAKFIGLVAGDRPIEESFRTAFGMSYGQLEHELRTYIRKPTFHYTKYTLEELQIAEPPQPAPMTQDAVLYELGSLFAMTRETADVGQRFLGEATRVNDRNAAAHAALGRLYELQGRLDNAETSYERAATLGSDDAEVYVLLGRSLVQRFPPSGPPPAEQLAKARGYFTKATELNPSSARAWMGLAVTYTSSEGDVRPGIAALMKAKALDPSEKSIAPVLANLKLRDHVRQINEAIDQANHGEIADAMAKLDKVIPEITDAEIKAKATDLRERMAKHVKR